MDVQFLKNCVSLKKLSLNVLCLYAMTYPLVVQCFMNGAETGTLVVQLFQMLPILALAYLWRFRRKTRGLKSYVDVWTISLVYFTGASIYFALFYAEENRFSELVYTARFLSWFALAATLRRVELEPEFWERWAKSFWIGAASQCAIALWGTFWGFQNGLASTYSNIEATTGSANVSGKTVVAFVILGMALSTYWFLLKRRFKLAYAASGLAGLAVVLYSYNRASQLGLVVAYCYVFLVCMHKKRFKAASVMLGIVLILGVFICSSYGSRFAARWEAVFFDQGNGRVEMIEIAGRRLADPPSSAVFWFGRGVFQVQEMMYEEIGSRIGMHNDALDFAMTYGIVGVALYVWAIYSVLTFSKFVPKYAIEKYFLGATSVFVALTGLFTGMFQATYVYFMLISAQYYWGSQALVKQRLWMQRHWANEALGSGADWVAWEEKKEYVEDAEEKEVGFDEEKAGRDARF